METLVVSASHASPQAGGGSRLPKPTLRARFQAFFRGDWPALLDDALEVVAPRQPPPQPNHDTRADRAIHLAHLGELSAARQALLAEPLAPGGDSTLQQLRDPARRPRALRAARPRVVALAPGFLSRPSPHSAAHQPAAIPAWRGTSAHWLHGRNCPAGFGLGGSYRVAKCGVVSPCQRAFATTNCHSHWPGAAHCSGQARRWSPRHNCWRFSPALGSPHTGPELRSCIRSGHPASPGHISTHLPPEQAPKP